MRKRRGNFKIFEGYPYYTPGVVGMFALFGWILVGALIGSLAVAAIGLCIGSDVASDYSTLISYPLMFIPAMIYASSKSRRNMFFEPGFSIDSKHFGKPGALLCSLMAIAAVLSASLMTDAVTAMLPKMPEELEKMLDSLTTGNIWINLICVSVMAPICEEWLCRGEVLRGLLNYRRKDGSSGMKPAWAIILSALFFAVLHMNPWQAIPAFIFGCIMGYVYYKTGSIRLTMLMHCANNTLAVILSRVEALEDMDTWIDFLGPERYWIIFACCALLLCLILMSFSRIPLQSPRGNCDEVNA